MYKRQVRISKVLVAVLAFGINSGAYVAEIFRSGIMSIDSGQLEAVSYTHLEQLIGEISRAQENLKAYDEHDRLAADSRACQAEAKGMEAVEAAAGNAVSYTHLDVYKRQGSDRRGDQDLCREGAEGC